MKTVLVTGASGFIGGHVCRELLRHGWHVRAAVRGACGPTGTSPFLITDITDHAGLRRAAAGVDAVVHLAGRAHVFDASARAAAAFYHANVRGTGVVMDAALHGGARTFLLFSSIAAAGANGNVYGRTKLDAENVARERALHGDIRLVVFRPPMVYGEGMRGNPLRLFRMIDRGLPVPVAADARRSTVYAGTLAHAVRCALERDVVSGVIDAAAEAPALVDFVRDIAHALGRPARVLALPAPLLRQMARVGQALDQVLPLPVPASALAHVAESLVLPCDDFVRLIGTPISRNEALQRTASWYRAASVAMVSA